MRRCLWLAIAALLVVAPAASPQGDPLGPEFRVNTYTTNRQYPPEVASDTAGNFVVVWMSNTQDGSYKGVFGQRFASGGVPLGPEFRVNTYTAYYQEAPDVASDASGNFVVVWQSFQDGSVGVYGQRYANTGSPLGPEFRVNTYTTNGGVEPRVASDASGNFVVVWEGGDGSSGGIVGRRFASSGAPLGPQFRVNTETMFLQARPAVASSPSGDFVVAWTSNFQDGSSYGVFGQRYASSGMPLGPEFRANTYTTHRQSVPAVSSDAAGNFVIVWLSVDQEGVGDNIFGQRFASSGSPLGLEFRASTYTISNKDLPTVASDASGNFVVVWTSDDQDGSFDGVFGQRYASTGALLGPEFRVNTYTTSGQIVADVATDALGHFVVVWAGDLEDGQQEGIFGQRYKQIVPVELTSFKVE